MDTPIGISSLNQTDNETNLDVGNLRRGYAFSSNRLSVLNINRDPLFRILVAKRNYPVPDTHFKITEERPFLYKRYGYVVAHLAWTGSGSVPVTGYSATSDISAHTPQTAGSYLAVKVGTDYLSSGNRQNVFGQSATEITIGDTGTKPVFFLENQVVKICTKAASDGKTLDDYFTAHVMDVQESGQYVYLGLRVLRPIKTAANKYLCSMYTTNTAISETYTYSLGHTVGDSLATLMSMRMYVVGNSFASGSGMPESYNEQPFSTRYGLTMILKQMLSMDNSTMSTELKIVKDEFARLWAAKVMLHKWDIANEIYFSSLLDDTTTGARHTQGIVDWCLNYGNIFGITYASETVDMFLEDLSTLFDPRYNQMSDYLFVVPTYTYNWLHKLGGYALNNLNLGNATNYRGASYNYDFSRDKAQKLAGVDIFQFSTLYGPMNVLKDIHLDGSPVKMLAIPLNNIQYRPLVGNGRNRDTTIYTGVQTIENTGVDSTTNLIQTEFGLELTLPETWAVWT